MTANYRHLTTGNYRVGLRASQTGATPGRGGMTGERRKSSYRRDKRAATLKKWQVNSSKSALTFPCRAANFRRRGDGGLCGVSPRGYFPRTGQGTLQTSTVVPSSQRSHLFDPIAAVLPGMTPCAIFPANRTQACLATFQGWGALGDDRAIFQGRMAGSLGRTGTAGAKAVL